ncbi:MAG TPA: TIGR01897 family CRISPR-associated protein, partial [Thermodesulfobacteriaceae bacterium]|nr:TIGR01897 family CRISPR-associated protein [Thermodesulfobacteriaceae bacterium]
MKLLIAPWGNPFNWKEIRYRFETTTCTSKTSLCVLVKALKPERILILVADSLVRSEKVKETPGYEAIKEAVKEDIGEFLEKTCFSEDLSKVEICVLPGTGYFQNGSFEGRILDYYYRLLYELAKIASESELSEIHLDLTHGLNFMPVLTYRAVKEILQVVSFFKS